MGNEVGCVCWWGCRDFRGQLTTVPLYSQEGLGPPSQLLDDAPKMKGDFGRKRVRSLFPVPRGSVDTVFLSLRCAPDGNPAAKKDSKENSEARRNMAL